MQRSGHTHKHTHSRPAADMHVYILDRSSATSLLGDNGRGMKLREDERDRHRTRTRYTYRELERQTGKREGEEDRTPDQARDIVSG